MNAYECLSCGCVHGWQQHPNVRLVTRHHRHPSEDIWYCPNCGKEHRTSDGSWFGQSWKGWREVNPDKVFPCCMDLDEQYYIMGRTLRRRGLL